MRTHQLILTLLLVAVAGCSGYYRGATRERPVSQLTTDSMVALEYLVSEESFSEIERAGAVMDALAIRYAQQAQQIMAQDFLRRRTPTWEPHASSVGTAIRLLEEAMAEFRGTRQELTLLAPLLYALKHQRLYDRWLDCYLDVLYRHPTADRVLELTDDALRIGNAVDREAEVTAAMQWMLRIPRNVQPKTRIEHAATDQCPQPNLVRS
ncbi:MAG: hypothetical protein KJ072_08915 [Verrucomicrobia bacterium]|nr:hypothetical protein [Verrucomicrobiota bacterium]